MTPKRCLVLGGSGALGQGVCRALAEQGARVAFTYFKNKTKADALQQELKNSFATELDAQSVADVEKVVAQSAEELGGLDALIQCIGVGVTIKFEGATIHHTMQDVDEQGFERMMNTNVKCSFFAVRKASEIMRTNGGGNIVLTGSIDGVKPVPSPVHYATSKGALTGMALAMAKELGEYNIKVNVVVPGVMEAGISRTLPEHLKAEYTKHCGFRRVGRVAEIASVSAWLALNNTYVTGQSIVVDGSL